ncbi:RNA polymerase II-associated protein 3 [Anopheles ziemanni]|uniref:RNA polymerase II-associated protein 3 n=1 Tax=Anopheles coustani TaxID=139045 RepID=UPI002659BF66|nr:RNA polymerase II-associated protein 3 [Anopheles coustani]XP_058172023.1 RNA polymerase II-associated protein 3 [Anopheles ziemanni]
MDAIESQLAVRNKCEQLQKSIKELYDWEQQMKSADSSKAHQVDSETPSLPPVRSDVKAMEEFSKECGSTEKQDQAGGETVDKKLFAEAEVLKEQANRQCKLGNFQEAIDLYTKAIGTYAENPVYYSNRALCYMNVEQFTECLEDCSVAIGKDPTYIKAYYRRMQAFERLGENEKAIAECRLILKLSKDENELATTKRDLARLEKRVAQREPSPKKDKPQTAEMNETLALVKQEADKYKEIGNKHLARKDFQKALSCYTKAIALYNSEAVYYNNRSLCHWNLKDYDQCLADCNKAIQLNESYFRPYYRRMQVRELRGAYQSAIDDCRKFLELTTDAKQKITAEKDLVRLERLLKSDEPVKQTFVWSEIKKNAKLIQFVQKPPHMRSKKPLRRVPINDVPADAPKLITPTFKPAPKPTERANISDAIIDNMFNNHTGEQLPPEPEEKTNLEHLFPAHSNKLRNMFSPPTTPTSDQRKMLHTVPVAKPSSTVTKAVEMNGGPQQPLHNKTEKDKINLENQDLNEKSTSKRAPIVATLTKPTAVPPKPKSSAQFYTTWSGLDEELRYQYLLTLKDIPLRTLFGASLSNEMLSELLYILQKRFIQDRIDVTNIMQEIARNESIGILSLMMNTKDRNAIAHLLKFMQDQHVEKNIIETIKKKLLT